MNGPAPSFPALRTVIFGGSFNPIHLGHIGLARQVLAEGLADEVWLMVTPRNPLKAGSDLLDEEVRYRLAQTAVADEPGMRASRFEFDLPRPSYTWQTLRALRSAYPGRHFSLLIGADNWAAFSRWAHPEEILATTPIIVYPRPGYPLGGAALPQGVQFIEAPLLPYASTDIRRTVAAGRSIRGMVPDCIVAQVEQAYGPHSSLTPEA